MGNQHAIIRPKDIKMRQDMFKVRNVDDTGTEIQRAVIEVTKTDLVLHQRGSESIKWPLRSLRRFGFDKKLFSFESGRRCTTGPGIYAFKCKHAELLFNIVQEHAHACGGSNHYDAYPPGDDDLATTPADNESAALSSGGMYGLAPFSGSTISTNLSSVALSQVSRTVSSAPFNNSLVARQDLRVRSSPIPVELTGPPNQDMNQSVNYACLKHDIEEDVVQELAMLSSPINDVNDNMENYRTPPVSMTSVAMSSSGLVAISRPVPYYMKPTSFPDGNSPTFQAVNMSSFQDSFQASSVHEEISAHSQASKSSEDANEQSFQKLFDGNLTEENLMCLDDIAAYNTDCTLSGVSATPLIAPLITPNSCTVDGGNYYTNLNKFTDNPHRNFVFDVQTPCSSSSQSSSAPSQFVFEGSGNIDDNRSPVSEHSYANLDALSEIGIHPSAFVASANVVLQPAPKGRVNYADLDMGSLDAGQLPIIETRQSRSSSMTSSSPKTPISVNSDGSNRRTDTYASIDFNRTTALANSQRQIDDVDLAAGSLRRKSMR